jgi:hypothetical protein
MACSLKHFSKSAAKLAKIFHTIVFLYNFAAPSARGDVRKTDN